MARRQRPAADATAAPRSAMADAAHWAMADTAHDDKIDDAAKERSATSHIDDYYRHYSDDAESSTSTSYLFMKEIDWTDDVYMKLPRRGICSRGGASDVLKTINKMIMMSAAMTRAAMKAGAMTTASMTSRRLWRDDPDGLREDQHDQWTRSNVW